MLELDCNGIPQTLQNGVALLPTIDEGIYYWPSRDLYNEYGCFSYIQIYAKGFTVIYHFYCTRRRVTLRIKWRNPLPEIYTSLVHPSFLFRDSLKKQNLDQRQHPVFPGAAIPQTPIFNVGFRSQAVTTLELEANKQYSWCSIKVSLDALPWHSFPPSVTFALYPIMNAWVDHGFLAIEQPGNGFFFQTLHDILNLQEDQGVWMSQQNILFRALARQTILNITLVKVGKPPPQDKQIQSVLEAAALLNANLAFPLSISNLTKKVGTNQTTLRQGFKETFNTGIRDFITNGRIETSLRLLLTTSLSQKEIAEKTGYANPEALIKVFLRRFNKTPGTYRHAFRNVDWDMNTSKIYY